jgi:hypothetical protein
MPLPLVARFPKLRAVDLSRPVIPATQRTAYPDLAEDFTVLDRVVADAFAEYDSAALRDQNSYRRQQVFVMFGSALVTGLGGLQAAFSGQRWPGVLLMLLGAVLATSSRWAREDASLTGYLQARARAERLRALHFEFLSATGRYAGADRVDALRRAVLAIRAGKEPQ